MTTANAPGTVQDDARAALQEVTDAAAQTDSLLTELTGKAPVANAVTKAVTENEVEILRARAQKERARGLKNLERRYDGIASVIMPVTLRERVVASAFERYFAVIENGLYVITRRGELFLGAKAAETVLEQIMEKIKTMEDKAQTDLAGLQIQLDVHGTRDDFLRPIYTKPAGDHQVQIRTRMGVRVAKIFVQQDEVVASLQTLAWNGEVEGATIDHQELRIKKQVRELATFIARTLRGMRNKTSPKESVEPVNSEMEKVAA